MVYGRGQCVLALWALPFLPRLTRWMLSGTGGMYVNTRAWISRNAWQGKAKQGDPTSFLSGVELWRFPPIANFALIGGCWDRIGKGNYGSLYSNTFGIKFMFIVKIREYIPTIKTACTVYLGMIITVGLQHAEHSGCLKTKPSSLCRGNNEMLVTVLVFVIATQAHVNWP